MKYLLAAALMVMASVLSAEEMVTYELKIKAHKFDKETLTVPAGKKFKLKIINEDPSSEEFESLSMIVEKFIGPKRSITVTIGPLKPGAYDYFGEFHASTCKGILTAK
jgi:plastocyanin